MLGPSEVAVAGPYLHVAITEGRQPFARLLRQRRHDLDRIHLFRESSEDRRLVAGSGPDLEDAVLGPHVERLGHERHDVGLRDGLIVADREGRIAVGLITQRLRHEEVARHCEHRLEHPRAADIASPQLFVDHAPPRRVPVGRTSLHLALAGSAGQASQASDHEPGADPGLTWHARILSSPLLLGLLQKAQGLAAIGLRVEAIHGGKLRPDYVRNEEREVDAGIGNRLGGLEAEASPV